VVELGRRARRSVVTERVIHTDLQLPGDSKIVPPTRIRDQIVLAAQRLISERGLQGATTRAIAEAAGCAEGSIYRYFPDKHALFVECIGSRFPELLALFESLPSRAGTATVRKNLEELTVAVLQFYRALIPIAAGIMADRELLEQQRARLVETKQGPAKLLGSLSTYLRREQRLGRLSDRQPAERLTRLILGAPFLHIWVGEYTGDEEPEEGDERFARETVRALLEGMQPPLPG
jgi:AcrR family transcriptional regulator